MQHTVKQGIEYITPIYIQAMTIEMNSDTDIMLKDDQENIWPRESTCQIKPTTNPYMQGDQNNHGKYQNHYTK